MFSRMLIRKKILYSTLLLTFTLGLLIFCSLRGVYAYRNLTRSIQLLSTDFRDIWSLSQHVNDMRVHTSPNNGLVTRPTHADVKDFAKQRTEFVLSTLDFLRPELVSHEKRIKELRQASDPLLATGEHELNEFALVQEIMREIEKDIYNPDLSSDDRTHRIDDNLDLLSISLNRLFGFQTERMSNFRNEMRAQYRTWLALIFVSALASLINVGISFGFFRRSVVQPFKLLLSGSRAIASGEFDHRIHLDSHDELAELADAMNGMTDRFMQIKNNLNQTVKLRTQEVVRSEQLASVGFLAAGVAHEINNPLASIAWSAEALESRLHEVLHPCETSEKATLRFDEEQIDILRTYLKRIQDEAFRCKGITERLLDFSRLGESQVRQETDIYEAVSDVVALVKHLGQYRNRTVKFSGTPGIIATVSETEFKQVVLNLLTNSLDACDDGDVVNVCLDSTADAFVLQVVDQGCGMTEEVLTHLFEPFYTRRRDGRGTGLGLSITYRIVQDHGGSLVPMSAGPGLGSTFKLTMPLKIENSESYERLQAA